MKRLSAFFFLMIFGCSFLMAEETQPPKDEVHEKFRYYSFGMGVPYLFNVDFASRVQHNHHGWEAGLGFGSTVVFNNIHTFGSYLYYPKPDPESQRYYGLSALVGLTFNLDAAKYLGPYIAPTLVFGREFITKKNEKRFIQFNVGVASMYAYNILLLPTFTVSYGKHF